MSNIVDTFYTAMKGEDYLYVAGRNGLQTCASPRKTMTFRTGDAVQKVRDKIKKTHSGWMKKDGIRVVKVTVEVVDEQS